MPNQQQPRERTSYLSALVRWLRLKKYQYEVTFSLYMLTPTEKFIFNFVLFIVIAMLITAASMYLPDHIMTISKRVWYYYHGEGGSIEEMAKNHAAAAAASRHLGEL